MSVDLGAVGTFLIAAAGTGFGFSAGPPCINSGVKYNLSRNRFG